MNIYSAMQFSPTARIDRVVAKKQFYEGGELSAADKKLFDHVEKIHWRYALKTENSFIQPFVDEEWDYPEIEVMEIILREDKQLKRLAEIIFRSIPYPMLLFFFLEEKVQLWLGKLRKNQADSSRMTLTATEQTDWLTEESDFWETLSLSKIPAMNFCVLYEAYFDAVSKNKLVNVGMVAATLSGDAARDTWERLAAIDKEIASLRSQIKRENQFNRKLELNTRLQAFKREKANIIEKGSIRS